ncbi:MAG TPA: hypothetical protein VMJ92_02470 [Candidatus Limnocylindrales bacterium]|nr:hypothetical protein [Candidatus Limnocylindrales bacterium]
MPTPPIHFRCVNDTHASGRPTDLVDNLTVHEGKWAYCGFDVRAAGHRWEATGGVPLERLVPMGRHLRTRGEASPPAAPSSPRASAPPEAKGPRSRRRTH